jgi:hypothetical protein
MLHYDVAVIVSAFMCHHVILSQAMRYGLDHVSTRYDRSSAPSRSQRSDGAGDAGSSATAAGKSRSDPAESSTADGNSSSLRLSLMRSKAVPKVPSTLSLSNEKDSTALKLVFKQSDNHS